MYNYNPRKSPYAHAHLTITLAFEAFFYLAIFMRTGDMHIRLASMGFHILVSNIPYFGNSAEEFHRRKTISTPIKLLLSLFINIVSYLHI
jgi:hypothetical protein